MEGFYIGISIISLIVLYFLKENEDNTECPCELAYSNGMWRGIKYSIIIYTIIFVIILLTNHLTITVK